MEPEKKNPLNVIYGISKSMFWILLLLFLLLEGASLFIKNNTYGIDTNIASSLSTLSDDIKFLGRETFIFLRPFLQLAIILLIVEWILNKLGISFGKGDFKIEWNVQSIIAILIIVAFAIAALAGVDSTDSLKDLALVVVGFYFGSQKKLTEFTKDGNKITVLEEHQQGDKKEDGAK